MNPEQFNAPAPPPPASNPYDFITTPAGKPPKSGRLPAAGNPFVMKLVVIVGGAIILVVVLAIVVNVLFGSKTNVGDLVTLTQAEQEIARVSNQNTTASDQVVAGAAVSTHLTILTQQQ